MTIPTPGTEGFPDGADPATVAAVESGARPQALPGDESATPAPVTERVPKRNLTAILLLGFASSAATLAPPLVTIPYFIAQLAPDNKEVLLGLALGAFAFVQMILAPFFGAISDRTTARWGMRRPGLLIGATVIVAGIAVQAYSSSAIVLVVGVVVMGIGAAVWTASFSALIPDSIPQKARGRVLGVQSLILVVTGAAASILLPMLLGNQVLAFGIGAIVMIVIAPIALLLLRDRVLSPNLVPQMSAARAVIEGYRVNPRKVPDYSWVWVGRFLVTLGIAFTGSFALYFLIDHLRVASDQIPGLLAISGLIGLGATVLGTLVGSFLSDKAKSRKNMVILASLTLAAGSVVVAFSPSVTVFLVGTFVLTLGVGLFLPIDGALVMDVLPGGDKHVGKYMSLIAIADQLPRSIGPVIAPLIISLGAAAGAGYPALYLAGGVVAILGGLLVRRVRGVR